MPDDAKLRVWYVCVRRPVATPELCTADKSRRMCVVVGWHLAWQHDAVPAA